MHEEVTSEIARWIPFGGLQHLSSWAGHQRPIGSRLPPPAAESGHLLSLFRQVIRVAGIERDSIAIGIDQLKIIVAEKLVLRNRIHSNLEVGLSRSMPSPGERGSARAGLSTAFRPWMRWCAQR